MQTVRLNNGVEMPILGYGVYQVGIDECEKCVSDAIATGYRLIDTAQSYHNEEGVGAAVKKSGIKREDFFIVTKLWISNYGEEKAKKSIDESLKKLQTDYIDIYYEHRVPLDSNVEDVAGWMGEFIKEGKIRAWGQSQSTEEQIRKAHAVTPLTAIRSEYSMMERMFEQDVIPACKELNIGFVAFSPMASVFLSGKYNKNTQYKGDDVRRVITRFNPENVEKNQPLLDLLYNVADKKGITPAQISLAWMLHKYSHVVPIPGMRKDERVIENLGSADVALTDEEFNNIETELNKITIYGNRTDKDIAKLGSVNSQNFNG